MEWEETLEDKLRVDLAEELYKEKHPFEEEE